MRVSVYGRDSVDCVCVYVDVTGASKGENDVCSVVYGRICREASKGSP